MSRIDTESKIHRQFLDAIFSPLKLPDAADVTAAIVGATEGDISPDLDRLGQAIQRLQEIQILLRKEAHKRGAK